VTADLLWRWLHVAFSIPSSTLVTLHRSEAALANKWQTADGDDSTHARDDRSAVIPDLDLLAPYLGADRDFHRRFTHPIVFAVLVGFSCAAADRLARRPRAEAMWLGVYAAVGTLSHAIADMIAPTDAFSIKRRGLFRRETSDDIRDVCVPAVTRNFFSRPVEAIRAGPTVAPVYSGFQQQANDFHVSAFSCDDERRLPFVFGSVSLGSCLQQ